RFTGWNPRIVLAGNYEYRLSNVLRFVGWCNLFEKFSHLWVALVAILHAPQIFPISGSVFEECDQIRWPYHIYRAADAIVVVGGDGEGHEAAVTSAGNQDLSGIKIGLRLNPIHQRVDVFVGSFAQKSVIELLKSFSVTCRAAHIGINDRHTQFVDIVVVAPEEIGPNLPLRAAVDVNDDRMLSCELRRRLVEESRYRSLIP